VFASGDTIMFGGRPLTPDVDPTTFTLAVDRRMHLQVELTPPLERADRCRVLDADGKPMLLRIMRGEAARTGRSVPILDGRTHIVSLGEGARTIVFLLGDREVARLPVELRAGEVTTVRW
jgi:hypothetical protein